MSACVTCREGSRCPGQQTGGEVQEWTLVHVVAGHWPAEAAWDSGHEAETEWPSGHLLGHSLHWTWVLRHNGQGEGEWLTTGQVTARVSGEEANW